MASGIVWQAPPIVITQGCERYSVGLIAAVHALGEREAKTMEAEAKAGASWQDQSGAARRELKGTTEPTATGTTITLGGYSDHNLYLEKGTYKMAPRSIIRPTLTRHYAIIMSEARALIGS